MAPQLLPRPELSAYVEYKPGLSITEAQRRYGFKKVIKLASNENCYGTSSEALAAYKEASKLIFRYPESQSTDLRRVLSDRFGIEMSQVILGAGSDDLIELLAKAYLTQDSDIIVSASSFLQYKLAGDLMGAQVKVVPLKGMRIDLMGMVRAVTKKTKFVFVANPNNPTGTYNDRNEMDALMSNLPDHVIPVIDEAYIEYARAEPEYPSVVREFFSSRPVVILRTFSKAYGMAGLRIGYGMAPEEIVKTLDKIRSPFNVSIPAQMAAMAALGDDGFIDRSVKNNKEERKYLNQELKKLGYEVVPSVTNFILFKCAPLRGVDVFNQLLAKGILVRPVDEYGLPSYVRVTVGTRSENNEFLKQLKEVKKK